MSNPISVTVSNESAATIQQCLLFHSSAEPEIMGMFNPSDYSGTMTVTNLAPGGHSLPTTMSSDWMPGDWWFGGVQFVGDPTVYYIAGYVSDEGDLFPPYKECNVPSGGSARFSVKMTGNNSNGAYMYVSNPDGSSDSGANIALMDQTALIACQLVSGLAHLFAEG
jgi:hypothetical protein